MPILEGKFAQDPGVLSTTSILGQGNSALLALLGQATQIGARINANQIAQEGNFLAERGRLDTLMETQRQFDITSAQRKHEFNLNTARGVLEHNSRNNLEKQKMVDVDRRDIRDTQENNARYDKQLGFTLEDRKRAENLRQSDSDFFNRLLGGTGVGGNNQNPSYDFVGPKQGGPSNNAFPEDFVGPRQGGPNPYSSDPSLLSGFNLTNGNQTPLPLPGSFNDGTPNLLPAPVIPPAGFESLLPPPEVQTSGGFTTLNSAAPSPAQGENTYAPSTVRNDILNKLVQTDSEDIAKSMVTGEISPTDAVEAARYKGQLASNKLAQATTLKSLLDNKDISGSQKFALTALVNKYNVEGKNELTDAKKLSSSAWKLLTKTDARTSSSTAVDIVGDFSKPVTKEENDKAQEVSNALKTVIGSGVTLSSKSKDLLTQATLVQERFKNQPASPDSVNRQGDPKLIPNLDGTVGEQPVVTDNDKRYNDEKINSLNNLKTLLPAEKTGPVLLQILKEANTVKNVSTSVPSLRGESYRDAVSYNKIASGFSASPELVKAVGLSKETIDNALNAKDPKTGRTVLESFLDSVANEGNRFAFDKAGLGDIFDPLRYTAKKNKYLEIKGDPSANAGEAHLRKLEQQGNKK